MKREEVSEEIKDQHPEIRQIEENIKNMDPQMIERAHKFMEKMKPYIDDIKSQYPNVDDIKNIEPETLFNKSGLNFFNLIPDDFNIQEYISKFPSNLEKAQMLNFDSTFPLVKKLFNQSNKFPINIEELKNFRENYSREKKLIELFNKKENADIQLFFEKKKITIVIKLPNNNHRIIISITEFNTTPISYNISLIGENQMTGIKKKKEINFLNQEEYFNFINSTELNKKIEEIKDYIDNPDNMSMEDYPNIPMQNINLGRPCSGCGTGDSQQA